MKCRFAFLVVLLVAASCQALYAQEGAPQRPPSFVSTEISEQREVTFRMYAPQAKSVRLSSSDLPGLPQEGLALTKADNGLWEGKASAVPAGAYRYNFSVDGVSVIDPRNSRTSESNMNTWSLVQVPGSEKFDLLDVPHGAVAQLNYYSKTLGKFRRMHVYTPPGYEQGSEKLPVFYLLHGAFDCDASWSTVGQAGQILDNLIATGKAKPMIVVMPMGHTAAFSFGPNGDFEKQMNDFVLDFQKEVKPLIEKRYRVHADRPHTAIAGLSMGGAQTLNIALASLDQYAYVGVFSSGVFGIDRGDGEGSAAAKWKATYATSLADAKAKEGLKLVWFATGKDDFLIGTSRATVDALKKEGFEVTYKETEGGHTWLNWRDYLYEFAPQLFQ